MKLSPKDIVLVAVAAVIILVIALFGFPNPDAGVAVTTTWTIDFASTPSPIAPGNITTWTYAGGAWTMTSADNNDRSVWRFGNVTSDCSIEKSGDTSATITIDFAALRAPLNPGNVSTWTFSGDAWSSTSLANGDHSQWTLMNLTAQAKCFKGETVIATLVIDFVDAAAPLNPGNLTTWEKVGNTWQITTETNAGHSEWVFKNVTSGYKCYQQLMTVASIGEFGVITVNQTLGVFVTSIAGLANQEGGGPGWQYYVNGVYANRACNIIPVGNGDQVVWKYQSNQMG